MPLNLTSTLRIIRYHLGPASILGPSQALHLDLIRQLLPLEILKASLARKHRMWIRSITLTNAFLP